MNPATIKPTRGVAAETTGGGHKFAHAGSLFDARVPQPFEVMARAGYAADTLTGMQRSYVNELRERFCCDDVLAVLNKLKTLRVLVVGEAIVDEYHYCVADAMSNKTPTLSARFESEEVFAGGVAPVGNHMAGLCREVTVLAGVGATDLREDVFRSHALPDVRIEFLSRPDGPTVRKRRFVHRFLNQKLFEITFLDDRPIPADTEAAFVGAIERLAGQVDVVTVLDFGHGFLTEGVVAVLRAKAPFLAVNAQINSSNRGFNSVRKYKGADFISVDEYELRLPFGNHYGLLEDVIAALVDETGCGRVHVTLGERGSHFFDGECHHVAPILTNQVVDTMGAGDASLAITSLLVRAGAPAELVPFLGNSMGGLMAQIVGHRRSVSFADLCGFVRRLLG